MPFLEFYLLVYMFGVFEIKPKANVHVKQAFYLWASAPAQHYSLTKIPALFSEVGGGSLS